MKGRGGGGGGVTEGGLGPQGNIRVRIGLGFRNTGLVGVEAVEHFKLTCVIFLSDYPHKEKGFGI